VVARHDVLHPDSRGEPDPGGKHDWSSERRIQMEAFWLLVVQ
jgi:hypothetical protein